MGPPKLGLILSSVCVPNCRWSEGQASARRRALNALRQRMLSENPHDPKTKQANQRLKGGPHSTCERNVGQSIQQECHMP